MQWEGADQTISNESGDIQSTLGENIVSQPTMQLITWYVRGTGNDL